jgi:hypothetical protein
MKYYTRGDFKLRLDSFVNRSDKQLSFKLGRFKDKSKTNAAGYVQTSNLRYNEISEVNALGKVHDLDLNDCTGISDVTALGNVHILNLSRCKKRT